MIDHPQNHESAEIVNGYRIAMMPDWPPSAEGRFAWAAYPLNVDGDAIDGPHLRGSASYDRLVVVIYIGSMATSEWILNHDAATAERLGW